MRVREAVGMAVSNLLANKLRTSLTLLGNVVGVMSVIAIVSIIQGMNHYVSDRLLEQGSNVFYVDKYGLIFNEDDFLDALKRKDVTIEDGEAIQANCPSVSVAVPFLQTRKEVRYRTRHITAEVQGTGSAYPEITSINLASGRHLTQGDVDRRASAVIIGPEVAEELFGRLDPVGREVRVGEQSYTIVGLGEKKGSLLGQSQDRYITMAYTTFQKQFGRRADVNLAIKSRGPENYEKAQDEVRVLLRSRRHVPYSKKDDFGITTAEMLMQIYQNFTGAAFIVMVGVGGLALVVGGIVIMNIMLVSVTERTKEIGVRKAVGARGHDILQQFLYEAIAMALTGGLIGVAAGAAIAVVVSQVTPLPARVELWSVLVGLVVASSVGLFFGIYPAMQASRLDPIEALRSE